MESPVALSRRNGAYLFCFSQVLPCLRPTPKRRTPFNILQPPFAIAACSAPCLARHR